MATLDPNDDWGSSLNPGSLTGSQAGSQTGGSGAGLPGFDQLQTATGAVPVSDTSKDASQTNLQMNSGPNGSAATQQPGGLPTQTTQAGTQAPAGAQSTGDWYQSALAKVQDFRSKMTSAQTVTDPNQRAAMLDSLSRDIAGSLQQSGHDVKWNGDQLIVDGRPYTIGSGSSITLAGSSSGASPTPVAPVAQQTSGALYDWRPSETSGYTPGQITFDDIPTYSYDSLMKDMATPDQDALMQRILQNPESMDAHTVDLLKAKSKDELAQLDQQDQQSMKEMGAAYGINESPWLAAATAQQRMARGNALIQSNRDIDIEAAKQNQQDRLAAAQLGNAYTGTKQQAVQTAANAAIQKSAAMGDRLQLREQVQQQAAALNIEAQKVYAQHIESLIDDATKRYGIDQDTALRQYGIDMSAKQFYAQLKQGDQKDAEDLLMQIAGHEEQMQKNRADSALEAQQLAGNLQNQDWQQSYLGA